MLSTLARSFSISTMFTRVFMKLSFFFSSSSMIFCRSEKNFSISDFCLEVSVFNASFCFFSAVTLASIAALRTSLEEEASISNS